MPLPSRESFQEAVQALVRTVSNIYFLTLEYESVFVGPNSQVFVLQGKTELGKECSKKFSSFVEVIEEGTILQSMVLLR